MAHLRYIDEEEYAAKALELFNRRRGDYVRFAFECLSDGDTQEHTRERLVNRVEPGMKTVLFDYLKRSGKVEGDIRHDYTLGYYRRKRVEPRMSDVPSSLLSISEVLMANEAQPQFAGLIDSIMVEAGTLHKVAEIEATTKEARKNQSDDAE